MSKSQYKYPGHPISRAKANILKDSAIMSLNDFYRIKENAILSPTSQLTYLSKHNKSQRSNTLNPDSNKNYLDKAANLKNKLIEYDKNNKHLNPLLTYEKPITDPYSVVGPEDDSIKEINKMCRCAKIATIREKQLDERNLLENMYKQKEKRLDFMMELERLKEIKYKEERDLNSKKLEKESNKVVIDQILDNERERIKKRDQIEREKIQINRQLEKYEEEEKHRLVYEQQLRENRIKECMAVDNYAILQKKKKKIEEKEEELKVAKFNIEKARKEEEYLKEKKRIALEKEKELQILREKQEKMQDKQAELDAIRAKRAQDEAELKAIKKEKEEQIIKRRKIQEMIEENEKHKKVKEKQAIEEKKLEKEDYEKLLKERQIEIENEKEKQRLKILKLMENGEDLKKQIDEKNEKEKKFRIHELEEGKKTKKVVDDYFACVEMIKQQRLAELKSLNIKDKYLVDLENFDARKFETALKGATTSS